MPVKRNPRSDIEPLDHPAVSPAIGGDTQPMSGDKVNSYRDSVPGPRDSQRDALDRPTRATGAAAVRDERGRRAYIAGADLPPELDPLVLEFLDDDDTPLAVPTDDPYFTYKWIRHEIRGSGVDKTNLTSHLSGRLRWDLVRLEELPERWREAMRFLLQRGGEWDGFVLYKDLILARTERARRDAFVKALEERARRQREQVRSDTENALRRYGARVQVEERTKIGPEDM
jgi:hypothetical protein